VLIAHGPADAIGIGISRTREVMMNTYLTFVRLFQQTVKIEHLKGPVGIAHLGTIIAERGLIWMLFFLALISVNLAVVNFLPLPIVDGGQFLLLVYEQLRGKPAPLGFQNAITLAGFALIGTLFLLVTFNDVKNLLGM
jgi:regulator of sigma E protease